MWKYIKQYRFYILLFLFLIIPLIALDTTTKKPRDYNFFDRVMTGVTSPIQTLISWTLDGSIRLVHQYILTQNMRESFQRVHEENRRLLSHIAELQESKHENERLRLLLGFQEKFQLKTVVARVIAKDVSTEFKSIRINRGSNHGIKKDMAVVTHEGIVGRILRTTDSTADVITMLDVLFAVDAIETGSRSRGMVVGLTDDLCQLQFLSRTDDVHIDDQLVTSGLGGFFPKGLPVGSVVQVKKKPYGVSQYVEVKPSVNFNKLEEVLVVLEEK